MLWFVCSLRGNDLNAEAAKYLGEGLRENKGLTALEYAACHQPSLFGKCQQLLTLPFTLACSLRNNGLGREGWCAIFAALRDNKDNKIESWDLSRNAFNAEIAKVLAEYVSVSTAITSLE